jgi:hypothetical protein
LRSGSIPHEHKRNLSRPHRQTPFALVIHRQRWSSIARLLGIAFIRAFSRESIFMIAEPKPINRTGRRYLLRDPPTRRALLLFAAFKSP